MIEIILVVTLIISWWGYYNLHCRYGNLLNKSIRLRRENIKYKNELALYKASDYYIEKDSKNG